MTGISFQRHLTGLEESNLLGYVQVRESAAKPKITTTALIVANHDLKNYQGKSKRRDLLLSGTEGELKH